MSRLAPWGAGALGLLLAGCAPAVSLDPAPQASAPICAEVLLALPDSLAGAERRSTTTQASRAWGDPAITVRCGLAPLAPTTERCITVTGADGSSVDWVVAENDETELAASGRFGFTTYGRDPAIEVVVPVDYAGTDATSILVDLGSAISIVPAERTCIGLGDF